MDLVYATYCLLSEEGSRRADLLRVRHFVIVVCLERCFCLADDASHRLDSLERILPVSRFTREHDSVGAVVDSVSDVTYFSTCR